MDFMESISGDYTVITLAGKMDPASQKELLDRLMALIDSGRTKLVIDCACLTYISSSGLRVLLIALKRAIAEGGTLRLCGVHANIREILVISGFTSIFSIFGTLEEAVA
jgi:anti-sigma B factor antagonist